MFADWKVEKAITARVDEAQALAERLATAKPHVRDSYASFAQVWQATYLVEKQDLYDLHLLKPDALKRFIAKTETKIAALRKQREYDSSDGLAVWLHTARALAEPRVAPAVCQIWQLLMTVGPNADAMTDDLLQDAGLPPRTPRRVPHGFEIAA